MKSRRVLWRRYGRSAARSHDVATYRLGSRDAAWAFMRACDAAGLQAGFPSLRAPYTVKVTVPTWMAREKADKLSGGAPVIDYEFAKGE